MDEQVVRDRSQQVCDALVAGDIGRATEDFSTELRSHLGEVVSQLPLPVKEGSVESVEHGAKGLLVVIRLVGESEQTSLHVRWKERDGKPTIVEVGHVTEQPTDTEPAPGADESTD